ncbi:MAG TPA: RNB domain-containing ribonuclease, partial [Gemmatimonadaceae bacterium]|nr:RNB domain-containing ribonuclease [Gemmatimonadaceae bacterium]
ARAQLDAITAPATVPAGVKDMRDEPWSSIDNTDSRDLDQIEIATALPNGNVRLVVAVADVDALVSKGSPLDLHASANSTSVYTGIAVFPMLPEKLSTGLTSLNENEDRVAIAIETVVNDGGDVVSYDVYRAVVRNKAQLAYDEVGAWLDGGTVPPKLSGRSDLIAQLQLQHGASQRLKAERRRNGALDLETIEATPVAQGGRIVDLTVVHKNHARDVIEDFMIASNVAIAKFLEARGRSGIRRVVREPERWSRIVELAARFGATLPAAPDSLALAHFLAERRTADPDRFPDLSLSIVKLLGPGIYALDLPGTDPGGHFGLATHDYTHATAPNRRYADLVTQRLIKSALAGDTAPYGDDELAAVAARCTEREDAENKVERRVRKIAAALLLRDRVGETFDGIVTGAGPKGTFVRTFHPPAEGMVVQDHAGFDVGDKVRVRLVAADPNRGFIDFEGHGGAPAR